VIAKQPLVVLPIISCLDSFLQYSLVNFFYNLVVQACCLSSAALIRSFKTVWQISFGKIAKETNKKEKKEVKNNY
jgi:hypothetical protein